MRNPWGHHEQYKGPFNDNDSAWTAEWKKQVNLVSADDGIFYLPVSEFRKYFTSYSVLYYQDWKVSRADVKSTGQVMPKKYLQTKVDQEVILMLDY